MASTESESSSRPGLSTLLERREELLSFVERRVSSRAEAEDILQEAFLRGLDQVGALRHDESVVAWFYRVLRNAIIDHYRRTASSRASLERLAREMPPEAAELDSTSHGEVCRCVSRLAADLKTEYAEALQVIDIDGVPVKDFAAERGITAGNAGVRVFRAREALRRHVTAACGACAEHACQDCDCRRGPA